jgi:large subunit ribosomal protein L25
MESIEIKGTARKSLGKTDSKKLRNNEQVPCVLYGGKENLHFAVEEKSFLKLVYTPKVYIVKLNLDGKSHDAVIKDIQLDPVSDKINHMDFYEVDDSKPVTISVPVKLEGFAAGVKEGGKLTLDHRKLKVRGLIKNLPDVINIDVTELGVGKSIFAGDLKLSNIEVLDAKTTPIASVKVTRAVKGEEVAAAGTAAPAKGAAPAKAAAPAPAATK